MKYEQYRTAQAFHTAPYTMRLEEVQEFAEKYDPHYYHLDPVRAKKSLFGSVVASGMHTMSIIHRQWVKLGLLDEDMPGGLGIDARWMHPVFPGDTTRSEITVLDKKERDENCGVISFGFIGYNQNDEVWAKVRIRVVVARELELALAD